MIRRVILRMALDLRDALWLSRRDLAVVAILAVVAGGATAVAFAPAILVSFFISPTYAEAALLANGALILFCVWIASAWDRA